MPTMFWYFPMIVFAGALDVMLSPNTHRRDPVPVSDRDHNPVSPAAARRTSLSS